MFRFLRNFFISDTVIHDALISGRIEKIQTSIEQGVNISRISDIAKRINAKEISAPNRVKLMRVMIENDYPLENSIFSSNKNLFEEFIEILPEVTSDNIMQFKEETQQFFHALKTNFFGFGRMEELRYGEEISPKVTLLMNAVIALLSQSNFEKISSIAFETIIPLAQERLPKDKQDILDAVMKHDNLDYVEEFNKTDEGLFFGVGAIYHNAARLGCLKILRGMYEKGITRYVNYNICGVNPLELAVYGKHKDVVVELLAQGAKPGNLYESSQNTITLAARKGCIDILDVFLDHLGKDEFCNRCSYDHNLFYDLLDKNKPDVFLYFLNLGFGGGEHNLVFALEKGYDNLVTKILKNRPQYASNFDFRKKCCELGRLDFFQQALSIEGAFTLYKDDAEKYLITAIINDRAAIVEFLCNAGLNPSDSTSNGVNLIELAQKHNAANVLALFKSRGMEILEVPHFTTKNPEQTDANSSEASVLSRFSYFAPVGVDGNGQVKGLESGSEDTDESRLDTQLH